MLELKSSWGPNEFNSQQDISRDNALSRNALLRAPEVVEMKICVVTPRFAIAGVPLAQLRFARALADMGHDVDLVIGFVDPQ